jgi:hypothetical protein
LTPSGKQRGRRSSNPFRTEPALPEMRGLELEAIAPDAPPQE